MKVLTITNMWPIPENLYYGIFVKEQVEGIKKNYSSLENKIIFINGFRSRLNYLLSIFEINFHLIFNKYDVIHVHFGLSGLFLLVNPFLKTPVILMLHGGDVNTKLIYITRYVARFCSYIFYLNDKMLVALEKYAYKMEYLPCGVDTTLFFSERLLNFSIQYTVAFPSASNRPEKNYIFFEEIVKTLRERNGVSIKVIEIKGKSREEVRDILNMVDVLVMTSTAEGSPQIIKEAMCCNTPVVSSNVGDVSILLENVNNCYVIDDFDKQKFCNSIINILTLNPEDRISNGRDRIFSLGLNEKRITNRIVDVYNKLSLLR